MPLYDDPVWWHRFIEGLSGFHEQTFGSLMSMRASCVYAWVHQMFVHGNLASLQ